MAWLSFAPMSVSSSGAALAHPWPKRVCASLVEDGCNTNTGGLASGQLLWTQGQAAQQAVSPLPWGCSAGDTPSLCLHP